MITQNNTRCDQHCCACHRLPRGRITTDREDRNLSIRGRSSWALSQVCYLFSLYWHSSTCNESRQCLACACKSQMANAIKINPVFSLMNCVKLKGLCKRAHRVKTAHRCRGRL
ncbi:m145.4 protein [Murid betaherpesvirus 1]|uniref:M145.4 protein n=1 Tax=Murid herpesvirus 1 (strain K181) TaxID=69156 RepID=A8E1R1_MUHVK|nr:m145.4 protein [Murid betaherpesvirus 1]CAJ1013358.1 m145.4 protein [Murid betaherpesvirus 1]CAJ1013526.1 m145.4 protein [Murid betaherpesvirus 1]CAP08182.1 m145.4 protein [Murine cytomegalovirus (strain K181)]